jgi:3,4-dihydroxy 2-butanone 4-phosphate synthase/GTP cyclohydrolase II
MITERLASLSGLAASHFEQTGRPLVTLTYAQSLDGSIAARAGIRTQISGDETKQFTHQLRALHSAILVGIGTVLADDPKLTARLANGSNPQPIILDSHARFPHNAQLLAHPTHKPWLVTINTTEAEKVSLLSALGARIIALPSDPNGKVNLTNLLDWLGSEGITSLMVEGGAQVITSFLKHHLVDQVILTIAPIFIGGLRSIDVLEPGSLFPRLSNTVVEQRGSDFVLWGDIRWD